MLKTKHAWMIYFFQMIGISAFLGSVLSMIVLGRTHDFSTNWHEIVVSRTDINRIIMLVNLPGLLIYLLTDLYQEWKRIFIIKIIACKWMINLCVLTITTLVIFPASIQMIQFAEQAQMSKFLHYHLQEDIWGPINMMLFLISSGIGVRQRITNASQYISQ